MNIEPKNVWAGLDLRLRRILCAVAIIVVVMVIVTLGLLFRPEMGMP